jgi:hypothetical protein
MNTDTKNCKPCDASLQALEKVDGKSEIDVMYIPTHPAKLKYQFLSKTQMKGKVSSIQKLQNQTSVIVTLTYHLV